MTKESETKVDRIYIEANDREKYDFLKTEISFFKVNANASRENIKIFMYAVAYAIKNNIPKRALKGKSEGYINLDAIKDDDLAMIKSIAVHDEGVEILSDPDKIYAIIQQYANAGIKLLYNEIQQKDPSLYKEYTSDVYAELLKDDTPNNTFTK